MIIEKLIMWYLHREYKKLDNSKKIFFIRGKDKDYPKLMYYTEDESVNWKMRNI